MSAKNVKEVLWVAIDTLVKSQGSLQERLASAAMGLVSLPAENGLPKEYQEALESIIQDLTKEPAKGNEGRIQATTRKMNDQEAKLVAGRILGLYTQLKGGI
ncbi:MAG: hypothetical protein ABSD64_07970 [Terriglobales bacterium]|jgi:hypothetical protein